MVSPQAPLRVVRSLRTARAVSILLLQHDASAVAAIAAVLEQAGFHVAVATDTDAPGPLDVAGCDVAAIGVGGSAENRVDLCQRLRAEGHLGAIVVLVAEASEAVALLDAGADDFVVPPIDRSELVARVQGALRRAVTRARCRWGSVEIDRVHRAAYLRGQLLPLTAREYALLSSLLEAGGDLVSRADLLSRVWGRDEDPGSNLVEVHLSRLRDKLGMDADMVETVRRAGYRLRR
jgi:DNA-binding response OmpR family regulator